MAAGGVEQRKALLIIVTFNSYELIGDLTATIREFVSDNQGNHAVVVENSGDQRVPDYLCMDLESEKVTVRVAQSNEGFSHGVNLGYRTARELWGGFDFVVLLNPDVISAGRTVSELVNRASLIAEAGSGIWSVVLRNERGEIDGGFDALVVLNGVGRDRHAEIALGLHHGDPEIAFEADAAVLRPDGLHGT